MKEIINFIQRHASPCPFKSVTGMECPGCGFQRSLIELLRGNFIESLTLYPALLPILFTVLFYFIQIIFNLKKGALILKYSFIISVSVIIISYLIKIII